MRQKMKAQHAGQGCLYSTIGGVGGSRAERVVGAVAGDGIFAAVAAAAESAAAAAASVLGWNLA